MIDGLVWPADRIGERGAAAARRGGLAPRPEPPAPAPAAVVEADEATLGRWIEATAVWLGVEAEPVSIAYRDVEVLVRGAGPALVRLAGAGAPRFLALLGSRRRGVALLGPDHAVHVVSVEAVRAALSSGVEAKAGPSVDALLARLPARRRAAARLALLDEHLGGEPIGGVHILRLAPGSPAIRQLRHDGVLGHGLRFVAAYALQYIVGLAAWAILGRGALSGHIDGGWLVAWGLALLAAAALRLAAIRASGLFVIGAGALLKRRLLHGAMRLPVDEIRGHGTGQLLGRVLESEQLEALALTGGLQSLQGVVELTIAPLVLASGAGGVLHALMLVAWSVGATMLVLRYARRRRLWTEARVRMTNDLVESIVGHRTRLVQEARDAWDRGADHALERYLEVSEELDRDAARFNALVPRGWLLFGLLGLAPAFVAGADPLALAIGVGGVMLGLRALVRAGTGMVNLAGAAVSFRAIETLYRAAAEQASAGAPAFVATAGSAENALDAHDLVFRYRDRGEPVLHGVSLNIRPGDRILLEGPSGGGKSTLASLLIGLREPQQGALLLGGLDRATLGPDGWRRRVVSAPQFHENHILTGTLAFNLLMGRQWPPSAGDLEEAEALCGELGLGPLLAKMPAGILQMVGESGWQLSHGEKSRIFMARALLQRADLVILDESFAALDPENLERTVTCVRARAATLLVIAHP